MKHAVWRINKWTPHTTFNDTMQFPAPFFIKDADDWLLMRAAQSRLTYIFTLIEKNHNNWFGIDINEFSHVVRVMLLSTAAMEYTFDLAYKLTEGKVINDLEEAPTPVARFLPNIKKFLGKVFGHGKMTSLESFFQSHLINDDGNIRDIEEPITEMHYEEKGTVKIIFSMNMKMLYNPLQSAIASKIFEGPELMPSNKVLEVTLY